MKSRIEDAIKRVEGGDFVTEEEFFAKAELSEVKEDE